MNESSVFPVDIGGHKNKIILGRHFPNPPMTSLIPVG